MDDLNGWIFVQKQTKNWKQFYSKQLFYQHEANMVYIKASEGKELWAIRNN